MRNDASLVPPIRQTASIFKQPVTIYKLQDGKVKEIKHGNQDKPKQVSVYCVFCIFFFFFINHKVFLIINSLNYSIKQKIYQTRQYLVI